MSTHLSELAYDKAAEMAVAADAMLGRITYNVKLGEKRGESSGPWRTLIIETIELRDAIHRYRDKLSKMWADSVSDLQYAEVADREPVKAKAYGRIHYPTPEDLGKTKEDLAKEIEDYMANSK